MRCSQRDQAVAAAFFRAYAGSGLVIQCLARFQPMPRRSSVVRMASPVTRSSVRPWATAHLGGEIQRPQAGRISEVARAAVQERAQLLGAVVGEGPWWRLVRT